jgi:hypothetical protein
MEHLRPVDSHATAIAELVPRWRTSRDGGIPELTISGRPYGRAVTFERAERTRLRSNCQIRGGPSFNVGLWTQPGSAGNGAPNRRGQGNLQPTVRWPMAGVASSPLTRTRRALLRAHCLGERDEWAGQMGALPVSIPSRPRRLVDQEVHALIQQMDPIADVDPVVQDGSQVLTGKQWDLVPESHIFAADG